MWSPTYLLDQAPEEIFQSNSDTEMYKKLTQSQMAKAAKTLSLRLDSITNFSVLDASFSESKLSGLEMENRRLQEKLAESEQMMAEFVKGIAENENELLRSDLLSKTEDLKSTRATVAALDADYKVLTTDKACRE